MNENVEHDAQENTVMADFNRIEGKHTWEYDLAKVNPNYATKERQWRENCQGCVSAYEARRRGYDVEALPNTDSKNDSLSFFATSQHIYGFMNVYKEHNFVSCASNSGLATGEKVKK